MATKESYFSKWLNLIQYQTMMWKQNEGVTCSNEPTDNYDWSAAPLSFTVWVWAHYLAAEPKTCNTGSQAVLIVPLLATAGHSYQLKRFKTRAVVITTKMNYRDINKPATGHGRPPPQPHMISSQLTLCSDGNNGNCSDANKYVNLIDTYMCTYLCINPMLLLPSALYFQSNSHAQVGGQQ